jgi:hypothetical protein
MAAASANRNTMGQLGRAGLVSGSVMAVADVVCQRISWKRQHEPFALDWARTARFSAIGLTLHGPL